MASEHHPVKAGTIVRVAFATATLVFAAAGLLLGGETSLLAAAGVFGTIWLAWDLLAEYAVQPLTDWLRDAVSDAGGGARPPRLSLDDTVRLLENHLARPTDRRVDLNAAIRLEEIYRTVKNDPARARRVIEIARERYPEAPELERYSTDAD